MKHICFMLILASLSTTASAQLFFGNSSDTDSYLKVKVKGKINFKYCREAGLLRGALDNEDEWSLELAQSDDKKNVFSKSFPGRLDKLTYSKSFSASGEIHPGVNYTFQLREDDWGIYGSDEIYELNEFTPIYELDEDLGEFLEDEERTSTSFNYIIEGDEENKNCLEVKFTLTK